MSLYENSAYLFIYLFIYLFTLLSKINDEEY